MRNNVISAGTIYRKTPPTKKSIKKIGKNFEFVPPSNNFLNYPASSLSMSLWLKHRTDKNLSHLRKGWLYFEGKYEKGRQVL